MNYNEVFKIVSDLLMEAQKDVTDSPIKITKETIPSFDLQDFGSLTGVMITAQCFEKLGIKEDNKIVSIFLGKDSNGHFFELSVDSAVNQLLTLINE